MMATFRKLGNTKASKAFMFLLAVSFVAWGVGGYLVHTTGAAALTVNGVDVSPAVLEAAYKNRLGQIQQMLGTKLTPEQLAKINLGNQVVREAVARVAMRTAAHDLGLVAAVRQLQDTITGMSAFVGDDGKFDAARYRAVLAQNGRTPEQFEDDLAQDLSVRNLAELIAMPMPLAAAVAPQADLDAATLKLEITELPAAVVGEVPEPTQAQLEGFYHDNEQVFTKPETRDVNTLTLSKDMVAKTITVPENRIAEEFNANKDAYMTPETRTVRHILVDSEEAAQALAGKIQSLADMEKLATTESKDPGSAAKGGLLGDIAQRDVVESFGKAAFTLPEGHLSAPVKSPFGWHLIWVEKVLPAHAQTLADVKDQIEAQLKETETDDAMTNLASRLDEKIAGGATLTEAAKALGMTVRSHPMLGAKDESVEPAILQAAFVAEEGRVAPPVTLDDGAIAYVEATKIHAAQLPPLADVKALVTSHWKRTQVQVALQQRAGQILTGLRDASTPTAEDVVKKLGLQDVKVSTLTLTHNDSVPAWLQQQLLNLYPLPAGAPLPTALKDGDTWRVVRLVDRTPAKLGATELGAAANLYHQRLQSDVEGLLLGYLVQNANVKVNEPRVQQVFGKAPQTEE
jgi:peptidyl-prolyl cis-trans isomerase D